MLYNNVLLSPLQKLAKYKPEQIILQNKNKNTNAGNLYEKSLLAASGLTNKGLKPGEVVLLAMLPGEEFLIVFYALLILRVKIAIIDNEMGKDYYLSKMQQLKPSWLFADSKLLLINKYKFLGSVTGYFKKNVPNLYLEPGIKIISTGLQIPFFNKKSSLGLCLLNKTYIKILAENDSDYENLIIYTSGTLSEPKGVVHTNFSLQSSLLSMENIFIDDKNVVLATYLPHFILLGVACNFHVKIMNPLLNGKEKIKWFTAEKVTSFFGAPYDYLPIIKYCEKNKSKFPDCLLHLIIGSAPVHKKFLTRLINVLPEQTKITCTYGMTEHLVTALANGREKIKYECEGDLMGTIVSNVNLKIADDGEIIVDSPQLFKRYLHQEIGSSEHASGDLGHIDSNGNLVLQGRKKDMIIRRNFNIYPPLYEDTIRKIPGIIEAVMVGICDDENFDEVVYLIVETNSKEKVDIYKKLEKGVYSIDTEALPDKIIYMTIPRCGRHQKIDKIKIKELLKNRLQ